MTDDSPLLSNRDGGVLTLTLNRPRRLNSLTGELLDLLTATLKKAGEDDAARVVVLTGAGRAFSAGADLRSEVTDSAFDVGDYLHEHYMPTITGMRALPKPIIAAIRGAAAGAGLSLAMAADLRVAATSARFIQAFVRIGLVPDAGGTYFLPRLIGAARAMEMSLLGDELDADQAERWGLVNRVVPDEELVNVTTALAERLARGPAAVGMIKQALSGALDRGLEEQLGVEES
ncbi:MAG: enoyl-CoA hydratase-related protein, partial [Candidatus Dormibacteria bacterium]